MGSTSLLLQFACLLVPAQHDGVAQDQTPQERSPVILHVAREVPQLQSVTPIRTTDADDSATVQQTVANRPVADVSPNEEHEDTASGGLSLNAAAPVGRQLKQDDTVTAPPAITLQAAADPTKRPPRPPQATGARRQASPPSLTASQKTPAPTAVEVPEVLRVRPHETARPAPAATAHPTADSPGVHSSVRDVESARVEPKRFESARTQEPTHTTARGTGSPQPSSTNPPRRLFDTSPIGSGVRRIPQQQLQQDDRWVEADQYRVDPGTSGGRTVDSGARARASQSGQAAEAGPETLQVAMAGPGSFAVGQSKDFQVVITNHSDEVIDEALVQFTPASGFRVSVLDQAAAMDQASGIVQWRVSNLAPGGQEVIRFKASASRPGRLVHTLQVVDREGNQSTARVSTIAVVARRGR